MRKMYEKFDNAVYIAYSFKNNKWDYKETLMLNINF